VAKNWWQSCLHSGRLRHRIDVEDATTPTDGETNPTYSTAIANLHAEVRETGGGEIIRGRQVEAGINAVITLRYRDDISPRQRIKYGSRYYNIVSQVDPSGLRRELVLSCKEVQP